MDADEFYEIKVTDISGRNLEMKKHKGRMLIIVNMESVDGFAEKSLRKLSEFKDEDINNAFDVLIFPCKEFLHPR